jgi:hypothetical protein
VSGALGPPPPFYSGEPRELPKWVKLHKGRWPAFAYEGRVWEIVNSGSHNNTPERNHICWCNLNEPDGKCRCSTRLSMWVEYVRAVPIGEQVVHLPDAPCGLREFAADLREVLHQGRVFTPDVLAHVIRVA